MLGGFTNTIFLPEKVLGHPHLVKPSLGRPKQAKHLFPWLTISQFYSQALPSKMGSEKHLEINRPIQKESRIIYTVTKPTNWSKWSQVENLK